MADSFLNKPLVITFIIMFHERLLVLYVRKIFRKTNICYPLIRTRAQGVRNASFAESFVYALTTLL